MGQCPPLFRWGLSMILNEKYKRSRKRGFNIFTAGRWEESGNVSGSNVVSICKTGVIISKSKFATFRPANNTTTNVRISWVAYCNATSGRRQQANDLVAGQGAVPLRQQFLVRLFPSPLLPSSPPSSSLHTRLGSNLRARTHAAAMSPSADFTQADRRDKLRAPHRGDIDGAVRRLCGTPRPTNDCSQISSLCDGRCQDQAAFRTTGPEIPRAAFSSARPFFTIAGLNVDNDIVR